MKPPLLNAIFLCGTILILLTQCQQVNPEPPEADGFDQPIRPTLSYLAGSVTLPLSELQAKINKELDPVLIGKGSGKNGKKSLLPFTVIRSGPVRIQYVNQQVRFSAPLQVQLPKLFGGTNDGPSTKPFCAMDVDFMSPLALAPTGRLSSRVKFVDYQWVIKPEIRLLGRTIELDDFAQRIIERYQSSIENAIDSVVYRDLRLDKMVTPIWQNIQKPLLINKQYGLWLLPEPVGIATTDISGDAAKITVPLLITLNAQTKLTAQQPNYSPTALPALKKLEKLPETADLRVMSFIP